MKNIANKKENSEEEETKITVHKNTNNNIKNKNIREWIKIL